VLPPEAQAASIVDYGRSCLLKQGVESEDVLAITVKIFRLMKMELERLREIFESIYKITRRSIAGRQYFVANLVAAILDIPHNNQVNASVLRKINS
jgi:hypothetical protein